MTALVDRGRRWIIATSSVLHRREDCPALRAAVARGLWTPFEVPAGYGSESVYRECKRCSP